MHISAKTFMSNLNIFTGFLFSWGLFYTVKKMIVKSILLIRSNEVVSLHQVLGSAKVGQQKNLMFSLGQRWHIPKILFESSPVISKIFVFNRLFFLYKYVYQLRGIFYIVKDCQKYINMDKTDLLDSIK